MAEGKETIIWYRKWRVHFDGLSDVQRSRLIQWFIDYTDDRNPDEPLDDPIVYARIYAMKMDLKRDLKKWENAVDTNKIKRSRAGKIGNLAKHHPDLHDDFKAGKIDLDTALDTAKRRKSSQTSQTSQRSQTSHEYDYDREVKKTTQKSDDDVGLFNQLKTELQTGTMWMEQFANQTKLKPDKWPLVYAKFISHYVGHEKRASNYSDLKQHLRNWLGHKSTKAKHPEFYR